MAEELRSYREPELEIVETPVMKCSECIHVVKITTIYTNGFPNRFKHLACKVRAHESLKPSESHDSLEDRWEAWSTDKFNDKGQCERWEGTPEPQGFHGLFRRLWRWVLR